MAQLLKGDGTWSFTALVDGNDVVVRSCRATWFGGDKDPDDNGETASGILTRGNPDLLGCALPLRDVVPHTIGSPIPKIPYHTTIQVFSHSSKKIVRIPLIDLGPAKSSRAAIDLTQGAFQQLGGHLGDGEMIVDFRILSGWKLAMSFGV